MSRQRGQAGASLVLALFLTGFISLMVTAVLALSFTGATATSAVQTDRGRRYLATAALDAAIQHGRAERWVGRPGLECPSLTLGFGNQTASVTCTSATRAFDLDRTVTYEASVQGTLMARATVLFRDGTAGSGEPAVDVVSWRAVTRP